jgi:hypothetical protein
MSVANMLFSRSYQKFFNRSGLETRVLGDLRESRLEMMFCSIHLIEHRRAVGHWLSKPQGFWSI